MDSLVMGSYVIDKEKQDPNRLRPEEVCEFELD
jgi:hypothetical protein